jgi:hypothetical protein
VARTIFLSEIILQTSCNRIRAETFAERFPDNRTHDDILIGYHALPKTVRILAQSSMYCSLTAAKRMILEIRAN